MGEMIPELEALTGSGVKLELGGKTFDLNEVPFLYTLKFYDQLPVFERMQDGKLLTADDYMKLFPAIYELLKFCDESIDEKWLQRKITKNNFDTVILTISKAIFFDGKKKDEVDQALTAS